MKVLMRTNLGAITAAMSAHVDRRAAAIMGKHAGQIRTVRLRVEDQNGPRGGQDKRCRVTVELVRGGQVTAEARGSNFYLVVDRGIRRAAQAVGRTVEMRWRQPRVEVARLDGVASM
jgi:putative sigma-54 modulation protein